MHQVGRQPILIDGCLLGLFPSYQLFYSQQNRHPFQEFAFMAVKVGKGFALKSCVWGYSNTKMSSLSSKQSTFSILVNIFIPSNIHTCLWP